MPRIKQGEKYIYRTWRQIIVDQIRQKKAVPILSNAISNDLILGGHNQLILDFADFSKYPLLDTNNLTHITQFLSVMNADTRGSMSSLVVKNDHLKFIKSRLCDLAESNGADRNLLNDVEMEFDGLHFSELAKRLGYPKFIRAPQDPLLILAGLELPIYLTTSYYEALEAALRHGRKQPHTGMCRWNKQLEKDIPDVFAEGYEPSIQEPLVYHLHGLDKYPASLVLTEDDYMEFLVAISQELNRPADRIHETIRAALTNSSLLLLGYDLQSWEFRTLFWGLLQPRERRQQGISLHFQIESKAERDFLEMYLDKADFEIFWGSIYDYTSELYQELFNKL